MFKIKTKISQIMFTAITFPKPLKQAFSLKMLTRL